MLPLLLPSFVFRLLSHRYTCEGGGLRHHFRVITMFCRKPYHCLNAIARFRDEIRARKQHIAKQERKCAWRAQATLCERHTASGPHSEKKMPITITRSHAWSQVIMPHFVSGQRWHTTAAAYLPLVYCSCRFVVEKVTAETGSWLFELVPKCHACN